MIRAVFADLDDTLLTSDKRITPYTRDVIARVRARGVVFGYATARGHSGDRLAPPAWFDARITMNGARARVGERTVYERTIAPGVAAPLLRGLAAEGFRVCAETGGLHYANFIEAGCKPEDWPHTDFAGLPGASYKLFAMVEGEAEAAHIARALPDGLHMQLTKDGMAMIMHAEASKARAVRAVLDFFGIPVSDAAAFGDDMNDIDMLAACGTSVAMANARPEVKAAARFECLSNDEDGVARWLEAHVLGGNG